MTAASVATRSGRGRGPGRDLKVGEVARRAGVPTSTVHHYINEGLLPRPRKTSRNMAYYDAATVERVQLIRELQKRAFLPLKVIKKMLSSGASAEEIRAYFSGRARSLDPSQAAPVDEATLLADSEVTKEDLRELERLGVLEAGRLGRRKVYSPDDATIVRELSAMRRRGLTAERGYSVEQILVYQRAVERLVSEEIRLGAEGVVGTMDPKELSEALRSWTESANAILSALHRKTLGRQLDRIAQSMAGKPRG